MSKSEQSHYLEESQNFIQLRFRTQGDDVISTGLKPNKFNLRPIKGATLTEEPLELAKNTLKDLYLLLEDYAPAWYTEELHERTEAALLKLVR